LLGIAQGCDRSPPVVRRARAGADLQVRCREREKEAGHIVTRFGMYGPLALLGTFWGFSFSMAKVAAGGGGAPIGIALSATCIGALILLAVSRLKGIRLPLRRNYLAYYLATGTCGIALPSTAFYSAAFHLPAGVLSMAVATSPMLTYALAMMLGMERPEGRRLIGLALGLAGVALLVLPGRALAGGVDPLWLGVALVAPACYAVNGILGARFRPPDGVNIGLACGMLMAAALILALIAVPGGLTVSMLPPWNISHLAILILGSISGGAFILFFYILTRAGPVFFSQVGYIVTGTGVVWGMVLFGERHGLVVWLALAVIIAGVALVQPRGQASP
jgi:drug/metabolite transporter (DMT)-like permease